MPEMTRYEPGTPSWVDVGSPDVEASKAFYGGLFGWEVEGEVLDCNTLRQLGGAN
jgi:predicted enzyme related to lactoylglutathione lyase